MKNLDFRIRRFVSLTIYTFILAFFLSFTIISIPSFAAEGSITGQVVDLNCWLGNGVKGQEHRKCAQDCADMGTPLAILTDDGKIYYPALEMMPTGPQKTNALLRPFAEERVIVSGKIVKRGPEQAIIIKSIAKAK